MSCNYCRHSFSSKELGTRQEPFCSQKCFDRLDILNRQDTYGIHNLCPCDDCARLRVQDFINKNIDASMFAEFDKDIVQEQYNDLFMTLFEILEESKLCITFIPCSLTLAFDKNCVCYTCSPLEIKQAKMFQAEDYQEEMRVTALCNRYLEEIDCISSLITRMLENIQFTQYKKYKHDIMS